MIDIAGLQTLYNTSFPKSDPSLIHDLLRRYAGTLGIESKLIETVASCEKCKPSDNWLGKYSPIAQIKYGKFWFVSSPYCDHLTAPGLTLKTRESLMAESS